MHGCVQNEIKAANFLPCIEFQERKKLFKMNEMKKKLKQQKKPKRTKAGHDKNVQLGFQPKRSNEEDDDDDDVNGDDDDREEEVEEVSADGRQRRERRSDALLRHTDGSVAPTHLCLRRLTQRRERQTPIGLEAGKVRVVG